MTLLDFSNSLKTRSDTEPVDPSVVRLTVSVLTTGQYFAVALATVLVYYSIITFDKEVRYFWWKPNPRNSISIIYFANRYIGILSTVPVITHLVTIILIDYILLIRVLALFHQNKRLSIVLKVLLGLEACIGLSILIYGGLIDGVAVGSPVEGMTICVINRNPPRTWFMVSWLALMAYGMILLVLALYKAAEFWKLSSGFKGFHLVRILIEDQVIYYGFVIFCSVCQIVSYVLVEISPLTADVLNAAGSPTLLCILGSQMLIDLKEAGERGANVGTNYTPANSVSEIDFGENDAVNEQGTGLERSTGTEGSV
ncbi:hypothetical protein ACEPAI_3180 [Sanghuangporus weigelae]